MIAWPLSFGLADSKDNLARQKLVQNFKVVIETLVRHGLQDRKPDSFLINFQLKALSDGKIDYCFQSYDVTGQDARFESESQQGDDILAALSLEGLIEADVE